MEISRDRLAFNPGRLHKKLAGALRSPEFRFRAGSMCRKTL